jgi:putative transposase
VEIERRQPWQNYIETHFNIMRRMADHDYAKATTWTELRAAHERFFRDYNEQSHFAHRERADGRLSPAAVLGWVHGRWCEPADLDRLFRLRSTRVLNAAGSLRFRHWRLYGERGLAGEQAAVWVHGDALTIEHAADILAQYHIVLEADGRRLRDVGEPRLYVTGHASPQLFLPLIAELPWRPAQRLAPYRPRQTSAASETQASLFDEPRDVLAMQTPGGR